MYHRLLLQVIVILLIVLFFVQHSCQDTLVDQEAIRVNVGGSLYSDTQGNQWIADNQPSTTRGTLSAQYVTIIGTNEQLLFQTRRYQSVGPMVYTFNVQNGVYTVNLLFSETYFTSNNMRVFDVNVNSGQISYLNVDLFKNYGARQAVILSGTVTVTNGVIDARLLRKIENPILSGIEIIPVSVTPSPGNPSPPPPTTPPPPPPTTPPPPPPTTPPPPPSTSCDPPPVSSCTGCGTGPCCNNQCYSTNTYVCTSSNRLCPKASPRSCGTACYSPTVYHCDNGVLKAGAENCGTTPPPPTNPPPSPNPPPPTTPPPPPPTTPPPSPNPPPASSGSCNVLGAWANGANAPNAHSIASAATIGTKLFIFAGFQKPNHECTTRLDIYDITQNAWTQGRSFPGTGVNHVQSAAWTDQNGVTRSIFIAGGMPCPFYGTTGVLAKVWRYDIIDDQYYAMPDLPEPRASTAVVIDTSHKLHVIGGIKTDRATNGDNHWVLDLLNPTAWQITGDTLPIPRNHIQGRQIGNTIYIAGGQLGHEPDYSVVHTPYVHSYELTSHVWSRLPDEPTPRSHAEMSTIVVNGKFMQFGGRSMNWNYLSTAVEYDPVRNVWSSVRNIPGERISPAAAFFKNVVFNGVLGDYVVVCCGMTVDNAPLNVWVSKVTYDSTKCAE
jgi:N-acetylneuraminic acid mutarotase